MALTRQEKLTIAYADLAKVNAAIDLMMQGKLLQRIEVGSMEFRRVYDHNKISLGDLREIRKELLEWIDALEATSSITFRTGATIPLVIHRSF